ncbi:putative pollen allergen Ole e 1 family [Arabidopsis thaliana]
MILYKTELCGSCELVVLFSNISNKENDYKREEVSKRRPESFNILKQMASKAIFFFFVSAVCLSSLAGVAIADADDFDRFQIQGSVYCDTCRVQFVTRLSKFLEGKHFHTSIYYTLHIVYVISISAYSNLSTLFSIGAKVKLECRSRTNGTVTLTKEAVTDKTGSYRMEVTGDHEEEVCELVLVESPDSGCSDVSKEAYLRNAAKISLTANDGIVSHETRIVNPLGFMVQTPSAECPAAFKELGIVPDVTF